MLASRLNASDQYLLRDLAQAQENGQIDFPSVRAARNLILGSIRQAIESVLSGATPVNHQRDVMLLTLLALGLKSTVAKRLCASKLPELELPEAFKALAGSGRALGA
ncbi:hypothetical protein [Burkholderia multivorans]|uniref:hypothetical protein n=1 Tax=Burkholderia multivorans TaxID=87883 RepID=UPI000752BAD0|nr:hypothetical protein [Burkholderia multivorans]AOK67838.1 hypothetical protein WM33_20095 [Burkholderia multivorans]KVZ80352.1 hypothetical protein WL23_14130 [Burkholderia multivorans]